MDEFNLEYNFEIKLNEITVRLTVYINAFKLIILIKISLINNTSLFQYWSPIDYFESFISICFLILYLHAFEAKIVMRRLKINKMSRKLVLAVLAKKIYE